MSYSVPGPMPGQPDQIPGQSHVPGDRHQQQYGTYEDLVPRPPDYKVWAMAALVVGVLFSVILGAPLGVLAVCYSRRVRRSWVAGDQQTAIAASRATRAWAIASTCSDVAGIILVSVIISRGGTAAGWM